MKLSKLFKGRKLTRIIAAVIAVAPNLVDGFKVIKEVTRKPKS